MSAPVIIEAAINGGTPKSRNPNSPRSVEEIAADAIRAVDAGAAIVHNHNDDAVIGEGPRLRAGWHDPQPYVDAWRAVLDQRPDTIFYPTQASGGPGTDTSVRLSHIAALDAAGVLGQSLIDPGCVALGGADEEGLPNDSDNVYINTYRDARGMFALSNRLRGGQGRGASISIFEPGFLRVVLAYHKKGLVPPGSLVKLYFGGGDPLGFGMFPTEPCLNAYLSMLEGTGAALVGRADRRRCRRSWSGAAGAGARRARAGGARRPPRTAAADQHGADRGAGQPLRRGRASGRNGRRSACDSGPAGGVGCLRKKGLRWSARR